MVWFSSSVGAAIESIINALFWHVWRGEFRTMIENALRQAAFQIGSLLNSTGYATADFAEWAGSGTNAQFVLLFAMFIGGSAGSTGGGVKVVRWLVVVTSHRPGE